MASRRLRAAWTIAAKDAREFWRDGRVRWMGAALAGMLAAAALTGSIHTASTASLHREAESAERHAGLNRGDMNPHAAAHYGAFVFRPVEPLSAVDPGLDPYVGVVVFLEAHQQHGARYRPVADSTPARRLGELSLADGLLVLAPLLIVTLASSAIVGERERGTLPQLLATGVSPWAFSFGTMAGCGAVLVMALVPLVLAGTAAAFSGPAGSLDSDALVRSLLLCGVFGLHGLLWLGTALTVSARARSSGSALTACLAIWFAGTIVAPRLVATAVTILHPSPSSAAFTAAVLDGRDSMPSWPDRVDAVEGRFLSGELPADPDMPSNPEVIALVDTERDESDLYDRLFERLYDAYDRQAAAYQRAAWLVPTMAARDLSMALADTSYDAHRRFVSATRAYRAEFLSLLNRELVTYREVNTFDYTRGRELWERIPAFAFDGPTAARSLQNHREALAALGLWTSVAVGAFALSVGGMRIR